VREQVWHFIQVDYQTRKTYKITIILKYRLGFSKNSKTKYTLSLSVTKRDIIRDSIKFVMEWRGLVHELISDCTKRGHLNQICQPLSRADSK